MQFVYSLRRTNLKWLKSSFSVKEMEKSLQFLVETQQASELQRQHLERLTRRNQQLQRHFREVSAEKAELTSVRVDLNGQRRAWREAMASQREIYVKNLSSLEESRRKAFAERVTLMQVGPWGGAGRTGNSLQDCADLQDKLDQYKAAECGALMQGRHTKLQATCRSVADESRRLRDMNSVLGALLLSDELQLGDDSDAEEDETAIVQSLVW